MTPRTATSEYEELPGGVIVQRVVSRKKQELADAKANVAAFNQLAGGQRRLLLVDMAVAYSTGPGVREYYATEEAARNISALAMVTHSSTTTIVGNFFVRLNAPPYPCKMFTTREAALAWLKSTQRQAAG